ncbi:hypothetical protein S40285_04867 [Stachybotrys chlorohalonatus IBT 40285]|uniref:Uncharacterized protein n=1 Tax=Stachybotrys chlorohalonatus (strain IBT 40285) TaxID=1283841 RepID=A0A084QP55_STAC4|nr:hypothetical protein S40285_04867 [Stachybotrys chlorohalonata IBT 40285]
MASLQMPQALGNSHHRHGGSNHGSAFKSRARPGGGVKPILKKLHSSHSEKNSLDLDRAWDDQTVELAYALRDDEVSDLTAGNGRLARDVSFTLSASDLPGLGNRAKYSHARSTSGASHGSIATTGSGRNGSFVHPFQQTPRTSTPPLSYANSFVSLDNTPAASRDYSPTITEDEFDPDHELKPYLVRAPGFQHQYFSAAATSPPPPPPPPPQQQHQPLLSKQRTSSLTDITQPLRMFTARSNTGPANALGHGSVNQSRSDLHNNISPSTHDASLSTSATLCTSPPTSISPPSTSSNPMSPLRTSLDMNGFRLRSRSELDTATRQEQVRQARRKFEEKEKVKEEKYAREQVRKRDKADTKEAQRYERAQAQMRKGSFTNGGTASGRNSSSIDVRPTISRLSTATSRAEAPAEKMDFASHGYDSVAPGNPPNARAEDVHFQSSHRSKVAKRKTTGAWTAFVLWLRTRLLKLGRR